jgi:hypothetical protein
MGIGRVMRESQTTRKKLHIGVGGGGAAWHDCARADAK